MITRIMRRLAAIPHGRFVLVLAALLLLVVLWSLIGAHHLRDWMLENTLVPVLALLLIWTYRSFPLSRISYTSIFLFLCFHELGVHWTYAEVPYDRWWETVFGSTLSEWLGFERNNFDRAVHFAYGLFFAYPIREVVLRVGNVRGFWGYFLPLDITISTSAVFELFEWIAMTLVGPELGGVFLAAQGDQWDAHWDMLCATVGAFTAMAVTAGLNAALRRDFARDFADGLRVKGRLPLGEEDLLRQQARDS